MVLLRPVLNKCTSLRGRTNSRTNIVSDKNTPFREFAPLQLKNRVASSQLGKRQKICIEQFSALLICLEKFDQNQTMCQEEIKRYFIVLVFCLRLRFVALSQIHSLPFTHPSLPILTTYLSPILHISPPF